MFHQIELLPNQYKKDKRAVTAIAFRLLML